MEDMIVVYITSLSKEKAKELAKHLLNKRVIACANIHQANSMYLWEGDISDEVEYILIAKTVEENFSVLRHEVLEFSDCQIPCIIKFPVTANQQFVQWVRSEIRL